jgi:hypothetical protein
VTCCSHHVVFLPLEVANENKELHLAIIVFFFFCMYMGNDQQFNKDLHHFLFVVFDL